MPIQEFTCLLCGARKYRDAETKRPRNVLCIPCHAFMDRTAVMNDDAPIENGAPARTGQKICSVENQEGGK
jgi:hypothetical protein